MVNCELCIVNYALVKVIHTHVAETFFIEFVHIKVFIAIEFFVSETDSRCGISKEIIFGSDLLWSGTF